MPRNPELSRPNEDEDDDEKYQIIDLDVDKGLEDETSQSQSKNTLRESNPFLTPEQEKEENLRNEEERLRHNERARRLYEENRAREERENAEMAQEELNLQIQESQNQNLVEGKFFDPIEIDGQKHSSVYEQTRADLWRMRVEELNGRDVNKEEMNDLEAMLKIMEEEMSEELKEKYKEYGPVEVGGKVTVKEIKDEEEIKTARAGLEKMYSFTPEEERIRTETAKRMEEQRVQARVRLDNELRKAREKANENLKQAQSKKWWQFWK